MTIVRFEKSVVDSILSHALNTYPKEEILLLRGKKDKHAIVVDEVLLPPLATHGTGFSCFPTYMLPMDLRIVVYVVYLLIFEAMLMVGLVYLMQQLVMLLSV